MERENEGKMFDKEGKVYNVGRMKIPEEWTFEDGVVAKNFDEHVRGQLPWYDMVTGMIVHFGRHYIPKGGVVYDIGAATGNIGNALGGIIKERGVRFYAVESSEEMAKMYKGPEELIIGEALGVEYEKSDFIICFLVLMFMTVEERGELIEKLYKSLKKGGALLIFEKFLPEKGYISVISQRLTISTKLNSGVSVGDIVAKELSLSGIQRPLASWEIPDKSVEIFRFGDFAGYVLEKL